MFYLIRHGQPDGSQRNTKVYQGFGVHLAGLSPEGAARIRETAKDPRLAGPGIILSSPYTRAVQTAAILSKALGADLVIETDLHEWLANRHYRYEDDAAAAQAYEAYQQARGSSPVPPPLWEDATALRARALGVLQRYASYEKVLVACHGMLIQAVTGGPHPAYGEIVEFDLPTP